MAVNALTKLAAELSDIPLKEMDGSPMLDENNDPVTATMFSPASKIYQVARQARKRKAMRKVRENGGKLEAVADDSDDVIEFLCAITKRFNGLEIPGEADQVRAIYSHDQLGYIRDQLSDAADNWENFTQASKPSAAFTHAN